MGTKIGIRDIKPMAPNTVIWDTSVRGFHARRQFTDAVTFAVFYRNQEGLQRWHRIGRFGVWTPDQARKKASEILRARDNGEDPSADRKALREAPTVAQLCDEYLKEMQSGALAKKASTIKGDVSRIEAHIKPALGSRKVTGVTRDDVEKFMRTMNPSSARRVTGLLGSIFGYAMKRKLRTDNPAHGFEKPSDVKKMRRLSDAEYQQLWSALRDGSKASDMILLLTVTGWRSGEVRNLKFSQVDLERKTLWSKLEMPSDVTPHTLRHSLGHARQGVTSRYMHLSDRALIETADKVANETLRLTLASSP
jgi:integrase